MEWISGNLMVRPMDLLSKGETVPSHTHTFDHTTLVFSGSVEVVKRRDGVEVFRKIVTAPHHLLIRAEEEHEFTALEDKTLLWCVYSHRWPQDEEAVKNSGWENEIYEQLNQLSDDVVEQPMGYSGAYT